jgi:hypothetical protein
MTAAKVIEEILHLPREEQSRVLEFAVQLAHKPQLSGRELSALAQRTVDSFGLLAIHPSFGMPPVMLHQSHSNASGDLSINEVVRESRQIGPVKAWFDAVKATRIVRRYANDAAEFRLEIFG